MKSLQAFIGSAALIIGFAGIAQAADDPDVAAYKQKMHDCATQMKTDHPDMNHAARHKACRKQLGPSPRAAGAPAATPPDSPAPVPAPTNP